MTIGRIIATRSREVVSCEVAIPVREAIKLLARARIGALPVLANGELQGIFSERDVINHLDADGAAMLEGPVGQAMTAPAITVSPDTTVLEALGLMTRRRIRHLPVLDGGRMIDFVSIGDLVKYRIDHIQAEAESLRAYIQSA
jgi:CBS domain-containing protein